MEKEMGVLYIEGVAIHGGPAPCAVAREGGGEALAGVVWAGRLSRERKSPGCRRCRKGGRPRPGGVSASRSGTPRGPRSLGTHEDLHAREPGGPMVAQSGLVGGAGR